MSKPGTLPVREQVLAWRLFPAQTMGFAPHRPMAIVFRISSRTWRCMDWLWYIWDTPLALEVAYTASHSFSIVTLLQTDLICTVVVNERAGAENLTGPTLYFFA